MRYMFIFCFLLLSAGYAEGQAEDTFEVYFPLNDARIGKDAGNEMDSLIFKDKLIMGQRLMLLGYADYLGSNPHNDTLSLRRARAVKDYLIFMGFEKKDIRLCIGKGKIDRAPVNGRAGYAPDRKVLIVKDMEPVPEPPKAAPPAKAMEQLKVNETVALKNISFEPESPVILPSSLPELEKLYAFLNNNKTVTIRIEGHVCCLGPEEGHDEPYRGGYLSFFRAKAVYEYLVSKGIDKKRLRFTGLGNLNPVMKDELTEPDRILNRRVEIRILSK
jgi:outer membrane protein OmpA-like peptidoglycan-associated protein